jgi:EAL domain-containing protein (putative c-di-GMP-specific phosphodiesterase class I)/ActR/RegA family two-component response regulator
MSVLVVDDNRDDAESLKRLLTRQGLERVYVETDSRKVSRLLARHNPDLVLLALRLSYGDGFEVLAQIRKFAAGGYLPVLVLTEDTTTVARNRALVEGAQDFLTKPVDTTEVVLRIANLLQTRELYATLRYLTAVQTQPGGERAEILARIEGVLAQKTLTHVFQPIQDLKTGATVGHEALSRFPNPALGGPGRWFADAFNVGLGVDLEWLAASSVMNYLDTAPPEMFLTVNMSPATVMHLAENELCSPALWPRLVIELTEQVPVEDYPALERALAPMRAQGVRHLLRLRPDIIKLDISLIAGIESSREQQALTRALLTFASEVGAQVIAEGIEEPAELTTLQSLGVPWGQGYLIGLPAPLPGPTSAADAIGRPRAHSDLVTART